MTKKETTNKEDFIRELSSMTVQEINELIKSKGKGPKVVQGVIFHKIKK